MSSRQNSASPGPGVAAVDAQSTASSDPPSLRTHHVPASEAINAATRTLHTKLNRLIVPRLPLALPPQASDPTNYLLGLVHVAPIYVAFEALWRQIVEQAVPDDHETFPGHLDSHCAVAPPPVDDRVRSILTSLYLPGLLRSDRLRADIASLTGESPQAVDERLRLARCTGRLAIFVDHIQRHVSRKPHVLVAYTYILYMALFAGGRFIRATLEKPGLPFWSLQPDTFVGPTPSLPTDSGHGDHHSRHHRRKATLGRKPDSDQPSEVPVTFLHFNTPADGEDLKSEYKLKLSESEASFTPDEISDIVQEGICIFENMILLVQQLDAVCAAQHGADAVRRESSWTLGGLIKNAHIVSDRFRDSIAVTRQRWDKGFARGPLVDDDVIAMADAHSTKGADSPGLCPASSKSVRFDGAASHPARFLRSSPAPSAPCQMQSVYVAKWLLVLVLGIFSLGAAFTGRWSVLTWVRA